MSRSSGFHNKTYNENLDGNSSGRKKAHKNIKTEIIIAHRNLYEINIVYDRRSTKLLNILHIITFSIHKIISIRSDSRFFYSFISS